MTSRALFRVERLLASSAGSGPVLGLDTASPVAALALIADGKVLAERSRRAGSHGSELAAMVASLMGEAGLGPGALRGVSVGIGPGSFTGLRVGLSYAKGLAMALGCPLVGVPTFDAMAVAALVVQGAFAEEGSMLCPVVDARKGEVYAAFYGVTATALEKRSEDLVLPLENLLRSVSGAAVTFVGNGKAREAFALALEQGLQSAVLPDTGLDARGRCVAAIGAQRLGRGEADSPARLEPLYVRAADVIFKPKAASATAVAEETPIWSGETKN